MSSGKPPPIDVDAMDVDDGALDDSQPSQQHQAQQIAPVESTRKTGWSSAFVQGTNTPSIGRMPLLSLANVKPDPRPQPQRPSSPTKSSSLSSSSSTRLSAPAFSSSSSASAPEFGSFLISILATNGPKIRPVDTANIKHIKETITAARDEIRRLGSNMPESIDALNRVYQMGIEETAQRMTAPDLKIAIVGEAGTRKSSLVNSLLFTSDDILRMGFTEEEIKKEGHPFFVPLPVSAGNHVTQTLIYAKYGLGWSLFKMKQTGEPDTSVDFFSTLQTAVQQGLGLSEKRPAALIRHFFANLNQLAPNGDANSTYGWMIHGPFRVPAEFTLIDTPGWQPEFMDKKDNEAVSTCLTTFFQASPYQALIVLSNRPNTRNNISTLLKKKIITPHRKVPSLVFCWFDHQEPGARNATASLDQIEDLQIEILYPSAREIQESLYSYSVLFSDIEQRTQLFTFPACLPRLRDMLATIKYHFQLEDLIRFTLALRCFVHLCSRMSTRMDAKVAPVVERPKCPTTKILDSVRLTLFNPNDSEYVAPMIDLLIETLTTDVTRASSKVYELVMRARKFVSFEIAQLLEQKMLEVRDESDLREFWKSNADVLNRKVGRPPEPFEMDLIQNETQRLLADIKTSYPDQNILENIFEGDLTPHALKVAHICWTHFSPLLVPFIESTFSEVMEDPEMVFELPRRIAATSSRLSDLKQELELAKNTLQSVRGRERTRETTLELKSKYFVPMLFDPEKHIAEVQKYRKNQPSIPDKRIKTNLVIRPLERNTLPQLFNQNLQNEQVLVISDVRLEKAADKTNVVSAHVRCSEDCVKFISDYQGLPRVPFHPSPVITWCLPGTKRLELALDGKSLEYLLIVMCDDQDVASLIQHVQKQERRGKGRILFLICPKELGIASNKSFDAAKAIIEHFKFPFWWVVAPTVFGTCREISLAHLGSRDASLCRALFLVESQVARKHRDHVLTQGQALVKDLKNHLIELFFKCTSLLTEIGVTPEHIKHGELSQDQFLNFYREMEDFIIRGKRVEKLRDLDEFSLVVEYHSKIRALLTSLSVVSLSNGRTLLDEHAVAFPNFYKRKTDPRGIKIGLHATEPLRDFSFSFSGDPYPSTRDQSIKIYSDMLSAKHVAISFHYVGYSERTLDAVTICIAFIPPKTKTKDEVYQAITSHPSTAGAEIYIANCPRLASFSSSVRFALLDEFCNHRLGLKGIPALNDVDFLHELGSSLPIIPGNIVAMGSKEILAAVQMREIPFIISTPPFERVQYERTILREVCLSDEDAYL